MLFGYPLDYLLDLDLLSFDRLIEKAREARNADLVERARIALVTVAAGFNGGDAAKAFDEMLEAYAPASEQETRTQQKVQQSISGLQKLLGG